MLRNMTTIYIRENNRLLMLYRVGSRVVEPSWCGIGGHFEEHELNNPKACVLRELFEETGVNASDLDAIQMRYITMRFKNSEIRQNYYFFANLNNNNIDISNCDEGKLEWVEISDLMDLEMPFTAKACLKHYIEEGQFSNDTLAGIATENGVNFITLKDF